MDKLANCCRGILGLIALAGRFFFLPAATFSAMDFMHANAIRRQAPELLRAFDWRQAGWYSVQGARRVLNLSLIHI